MLSQASLPWGPGTQAPPAVFPSSLTCERGGSSCPHPHLSFLRARSHSPTQRSEGTGPVLARQTAEGTGSERSGESRVVVPGRAPALAVPATAS